MLDKYKKINSLEDDNCAFNSFVLAFLDLAFTETLDKWGAAGKYDLLLTKCHEKLSIPKTWHVFKQYLYLHKNNPLFLQKTFAPIFRSLVTDIKKEKRQLGGTAALDSETEALQAEFGDFIFKKLKLLKDEKFAGGDIYSRHKLIVSKFTYFTVLILNDLQKLPKFNMKDLKAANSLLVQKIRPPKNLIEVVVEFEKIATKRAKELVTWFREEGYAHFLNEMDLQGTWAGDIELKELAELFELNLTAWNSDNYSYNIYNFHGVIEANNFSKNEIAKLVQRGIVEEDSGKGQLKLLELTKSELALKLGEVPYSSWVLEDWQKQEEIGRKVVAPDIVNNTILLSMLMERGIVKQDAKFYYYFMDLTRETLLEKLEALKCSEEFQNQWQNAYVQRLKIYLSNPSASHWYYLQPRDRNTWNLDSYDVSYRFFTEEDMLINFFAMTLEDNNWFTSSSNDSQLPPQRTLKSEKSDETRTPVASMDRSIQEKNLEMTDVFFPTPPRTGIDIPKRKSPVMFEDSKNTYRSWGTDPELSKCANGGFFASKTPSPVTSKTPSPVNSPLSCSPPSSNTALFPTSTPKPKQAVRSKALKYAAEVAYTQLQKDATGSALVKDLIEAYTFIHGSGEICKKDSFLLLDPKKYARIKGIKFIELPPEVEAFRTKFFCELLQQAQKLLAEQLAVLRIWLGVSLKDCKKPNNIMSFLDQLHNIFKTFPFKISMLRELFEKFDMNSIDSLESNLTNQDTIQKLRELREYLYLADHLAHIITPQAFASSILELYNNHSGEEFIDYKKLFTDICREGFSIDNDLQDLLEFKSDPLSKTPGIGKAIDLFVDFFQDELTNLYSFSPQIP